MARTKEDLRDYRQAKKLAKRLGCMIDIEMHRDGPTYWVYGPNKVYYPDDGETPTGREDPCAGAHSCCGWGEVLGLLKDYELDLFWHRWGLEHPGPLYGIAHQMLRDWMADDRLGMVLADYLEDGGKAGLAERIRQAVIKRVRGER